MVTREVPPTPGLFGHHDGRGRALGVDGVVVGVGGAAAGVARSVLHAVLSRVIRLLAVGDVAGRREGRRPGDAAVAAADRAQRAVGDRQVGVAETGHRFAEGDGHQRGLADLQRAVATTMVAVGRTVSMV
jgi:hypothetical protein